MFVIATVGTISTGAVDSLSLVRIREPRGDEGEEELREVKLLTRL